MKQNRTFFILALAFVLVLGGAYVLYQHLAPSHTGNTLVIEGAPSSPPQDSSAGAGPAESSQEQSSAQPVSAPDFTVYDGEGNEVHLSDFAGKPIVLNFWASWCGPCKSEMPDFNQAFLDYGGQVHFLMVNMTDGERETVDSASAFIAEQGYAFPVFYDTDYDAALTYGAYALPTTYFIDAEGYAVAWAQSALSGESLQKGLDMILPQ